MARPPANLFFMTLSTKVEWNIGNQEQYSLFCRDGAQYQKEVQYFLFRAGSETSAIFAVQGRIINKCNICYSTETEAVS